MSDAVLLEARGAAFWITINRPDKRNAIDFDVRELLTQHLREVVSDGETRALVLDFFGRRRRERQALTDTE